MSLFHSACKTMLTIDEHNIKKVLKNVRNRNTRCAPDSLSQRFINDSLVISAKISYSRFRGRGFKPMAFIYSAVSMYNNSVCLAQGFIRFEISLSEVDYSHFELNLDEQQKFVLRYSGSVKIFTRFSPTTQFVKRELKSGMIFVPFDNRPTGTFISLFSVTES